ncbi:hypothetical protein F5X99DRAFT_403815 [Biscogniauxia marginata]|nr:hypothetical protein F5X99DRAFT_403815 [Biscogniauxia marginata]
MATEEPQSLPLDEQPVDPAPVEEMAVDEPSAETINGHAKTDEDQPKSDDAPVVNGDAKSPASTAEATKDLQNHEAFVANNNLPEKSPSKPNIESPSTKDSEMAGMNGDSNAEKKVSPSEESSKEEAAGSQPDGKASSTEPTAATGEPSRNGPISEQPADSMDVDVSTDQPDLTSSAEHADSTQNTSTVSDAPIVSSPQTSNQPAADLSKLDIKSTQDEASPQADVSMTEPPASPAKVSREREEDEGDERATKRAKTDDTGDTVAESLVVATGLPSAPQTTGESPGGAVPNGQAITEYQNKQIRQILASIKKTKNGGFFRNSVEKLWPTLWNDYKMRIDNPVDLASIEARLRAEEYANYGAFKADVQLLYDNSLTFNGPDNAVTVGAALVRDQIFTKLPEVSKMKEPVKPEKGKSQPTRHTEPRAATQPRRQSQSQAHGASSGSKQKSEPTAPPTPASATAPAFAIPPGGIPQIRRDSTREDSDRPKRPIHPPKNRDLDYSSKANRKKKLEPEQRFFETVLDELKKAKHFTLNQWFLKPVDPVALNIPQYFKIVKKPMDLTTMTQRNYDGEYKATKDIEKDMKLLVHNAELFNGPDHDVTRLAKQLEELFKAELSKKDEWMDKNYPPEAPSAANAAAPSPGRSTAGSDEESEAEGDEDDSNEAIRNLQGRLNEEQDKLNTLLGSKKPDLTMIEIQQSMVSMIQRKLVEEKTKFHSDEKKSKAKKKNHSNAKSKPKAGGNSAVIGGSKKSSGQNALAVKKAQTNHKKPAPKKRTIGPLEKAVIAEGINELDGNTLTKAVEIIKRDTGQNPSSPDISVANSSKENDDGEMELDIDALTAEALAKLYDLINKAHPLIRATVEQKPEFSNSAPQEAEPRPKPSGSSKTKKNKPMNKHEQERKIEQLRELKAQLQRHGSGSQEPIPADAEEPTRGESSEEESDSEEE